MDDKTHIIWIICKGFLLKYKIRLLHKGYFECLGNVEKDEMRSNESTKPKQNFLQNTLKGRCDFKSKIETTSYFLIHILKYAICSWNNMAGYKGIKIVAEKTKYRKMKQKAIKWVKPNAANVNSWATFKNQQVKAIQRTNDKGLRKMPEENTQKLRKILCMWNEKNLTPHNNNDTSTDRANMFV